ncbi:unnamed protein product [Rhodiola kirilowii]
MASRPASKRRRTETKDATEPVSSSTNTTKLRPVVVFAHGAGAPSSSEWMIRWICACFYYVYPGSGYGEISWKKSLEAVEVITFDYPYSNSCNEPYRLIWWEKESSSKAEKLIDYHLEVVNEASKKYPDHPLVLAGKSMGSRVSCMVAACEDSGVSAVICLGYPLKFFKWFVYRFLNMIAFNREANGKVRDETLLQLRTPTMFVQGSKDGLCPLERLEAVRTNMECPNKLHVIEGGDHSFKISKKTACIEWNNSRTRLKILLLKPLQCLLHNSYESKVVSKVKAVCADILLYYKW